MAQPRASWVLLVGWALATPVPATAADYVLTSPRLEPAWGQGPDGPVAPNDRRDAGRDLAGPAAARAYQAAMLAAAPSLDEAASFHWFEITATYLSMHGAAPTPDIAGPQVQQALKNKQDEVQHALFDELDARFAKLTDAMEHAEAILLPPGDQAGPSGPVPYCGWIGSRAQYVFTPLGKALLARCLQDRDAFIGKLAVRLAALATVPDLPSGTEPPRSASAGGVLSDPGLRALAGLHDLGSPAPAPDGLRLSRAVLPADQRWPLDYAPLAQAYERTLRARFEAKQAQLSGELRQVLQARAGSDVIRPAEEECRAILGPYAGLLAQGSASASVAGMLHDACTGAIGQHTVASLGRIRAAVVAGFDAMAAEAGRDMTGTTRVGHAPAAACRIALQPFFPSQAVDPYAGWSLAGLDQAQAADLEGACVAAAGRLNAAVVARHVADALAGVDGGMGTLAAWDAAFWSPGAAGRLDWIGGEDMPTAGAIMTAFRAAYEAGMAPRRTAAARHWAGEIERAFAVDTGMEPPGAGGLCAPHYRGTGGDIMQSWFGVKPDEAVVGGAIDAIRAKPVLSAQEAQYWIAELCRSLHERTIARRVAMATERAGIPATFKEGEKFAVPSPRGKLQFFDPTKLVRAAAVDGLQVILTPGGWRNDAGVRVTPFGQTDPLLEGSLRKATRVDGIRFLEVVGLPSLRGLDGPLATIECVGTPVQEAYRQGRAGMLRGYALALFDDMPVAGGLLAEDARQAMLDVQACDAAKKSFRQSGVGQ